MSQSTWLGNQVKLDGQTESASSGELVVEFWKKMMIWRLILGPCDGVFL